MFFFLLPLSLFWGMCPTVLNYDQPNVRYHCKKHCKVINGLTHSEFSVINNKYNFTSLAGDTNIGSCILLLQVERLRNLLTLSLSLEVA